MVQLQREMRIRASFTANRIPSEQLAWYGILEKRIRQSILKTRTLSCSDVPTLYGTLGNTNTSTRKASLFVWYSWRVFDIWAPENQWFLSWLHSEGGIQQIYQRTNQLIHSFHNAIISVRIRKKRSSPASNLKYSAPPPPPPPGGALQNTGFAGSAPMMKGVAAPGAPCPPPPQGRAPPKLKMRREMDGCMKCKL